MPALARPAALPAELAPELATLVDHPPRTGQWIYEIKFDGYRLLSRIEGDDVRLFTRRGNDWTDRLQSLAAAVRALQLPSAWLDGEIVVHGAHGTPDFNALQNAFDASRTERIVYYVFDLPYYAGHDLRQVPLHERRALLARVLQGRTNDCIRWSEDFPASPEEILASACRMHLEGVIGKRRDSPYLSRRTADWIKLKCTHRQEFVVVGYTDPEGSRVGLGALLLGFHDEQGALRYAGKVGTGFDTSTLRALERELKPLAIDKTPLVAKPAEARGHWVQPRLVAEVSFAEWTPDGRIRQAVFHGLRRDKPAAAVGREQAVPVSRVVRKTGAREKRSPPASASGSEGVAGAKPASKSSGSSARRASSDEDDELARLPGNLRITHGERVVDPSTGATKQDLVNHYLRVARRMLPHLQRRPAALLRAPQGIQRPLFFQKHAETLRIPDITLLDRALDPGRPPMIEIDSFVALIGAVQMNVVEFHTWNARSSRIDKPDRMTFDLDPGEGVEWPAVQEAAQLARGLLEELGLRCFLKTSGGKGLHVVVPLAPRDDWDTVKDFAQAVVQHMAHALPHRFVARSGAAHRVGRIFIDYLRNGRGATTAAAFSARARPGLGVSMPCAWDELRTLTSGAHWTIANAHERLEFEEDPWADYASTRQTLARAMKSLGRKH